MEGSQEPVKPLFEGGPKPGDPSHPFRPPGLEMMMGIGLFCSIMLVWLTAQAIAFTQHPQVLAASAEAPLAEVVEAYDGHGDVVGFVGVWGHGTAALVLLLALLLAPEVRSDGRTAPGWHRAAMALAGCFLLASLPMTGSRAMGLLAMVGLVAVPVLNGTVLRALRSPRVPRSLVWPGMAAAAALLVGVILTGLQWLRVDANEEVRAALAVATYGMGWQLAPWGGGVGSFVPWFDQFAPDPLFAWEYFNHAHNEYVQWWLESGVPGMVALAAALALLVWCRPSARRGDRDPGSDAPAVGSWVAVVLVLAHSGVDYPLRTPTMMGVTALLAGIAVAAALSRTSKATGSTMLRVRKPRADA